MLESLLMRSVEVFDGLRVLPGRRDVTVRDGRIESVAAAGSFPVEERVIEGGAVLPGIVDAHVHVSFSDPALMVRRGVTGALDLGEPTDVAFASHRPLRLRASGPLLTAPGGYPTRSWGANGFGLEVGGLDEARRAVAMLADRGAAIIKVACTDEPTLDPDTIAAIVEAAAAQDLRVAAHALREIDVRTAMTAGVDVLAHTPIEPLPPDLVGELGRRDATVISTVRAFGGAAATRANLAALAEAGCRVLYGTDLGNEGVEPGVDADELAILAQALGGAEAALRAATADAAELAGLGSARVHPGNLANLIVCDGLDFAALSRPSIVLVDGEEIR